MYMNEFRQALERDGHPYVRDALIRELEKRGDIPRAGRDWRGFRTFGPEHLAAVKQRLAKRKQQPDPRKGR
jgi:hypothetical protein